MSSDYTNGFNVGYSEGYKSAKDEVKRREIKVSELEEKLGKKNTTLKTVEKKYLDCLDKIKELEKIIAESTSVTLTVGFISMDARVSCITTGQFIDLNDDTESPIFYESKGSLFADLQFKELSKCEVTGYYVIKDNARVFCIKSIKAVNKGWEKKI